MPTPRKTGKEFHEFQESPPRLSVDVLCQDPLVQKTTGLGLVRVKLDGERYLERGPTTARVEVIDFDAETGTIHDPVPVRQNGTGFAVGAFRNDIRSNFFFHQVNVWAIVNRTLALLEEPGLLGRPVPWASGRGRLVVMPHAGRGTNAYYDREAGALRFLYFGDQEQRVFSCLSHDIVTHELGHAVLDGLKPGYDEVSSPEAAGFHEYFGDALALASALTFREVLVKAVGKAPPVLNAEFLDHIGEEFGTADSRGEQGYVRRFSDRWTLAELIQNDNQNAHDYSQVLSGVFFEFLAFLYVLKLEETRARRQRLNGGVAVAALVNAARQAARTMLCAVDYCPPVDVSFLQYARAVLRAEQVAFPNDGRGIRTKVAELFNARGIGAHPADLESSPRLHNRDLHPYDVDTLAATSEAAYRFLDENRTPLRIPRRANFQVVRRYRTRKATANGYFPPREVILEFVWTEDISLDADAARFGTLAGAHFPVHCGGTLVFDGSGNVLHYVLVKSTDDRRRRLDAYLSYLVKRGQIGMPGQDKAPIVAFRDGDRVRLQRTPMLRHEGRRLSGRTSTNP